MRTQIIISATLICIMFFSCKQKQKADLLIFNATIYTIDSNFSTAEAMVVADGKVLATGTRDSLEKIFAPDDTLNAGGKFIYPGFIDAHAHFFGYAQSLMVANLQGTKSWEDILEQLKKFAAENKDGWILGRGWDQNDWPDKRFPDNKLLNELFPDRPVFLRRVDGHAAIVNNAALQLAAVKPGATLTGGVVEMRNNQLTGILIDNATALVASKIPTLSTDQTKKGIELAQQNCFATGLTTIHDCGLDFEQVELLQKMQDDSLLKMKLYVMLSDAKKNYEYLFKHGIIKTDYMHVRGFKVYADGALGSRGACLLQPYSDQNNWSGFLLSEQKHFDSVASIIYQKNFQMCTHAIGDSANRMILDIYSKYLTGKNDRRWRVEHAQVVNPADIDLFGKYAVIPSVQPTHATSDMYWAEERLGKERVKGAYAFQQLLSQNEWIPLGTDFPVEDISPFKTFFAAVVRQDAAGWPVGGFQTENKLSRQDALRGMTIWAAKAAFEENEKGSLEKGKSADFIVLDTDLMTAPESQLLGIRVLKTFSNGRMVFEKK